MVPVRSAECGMRNGSNAECGVRNAEWFQCGVRNAQCGMIPMRSAEWSVTSWWTRSGSPWKLWTKEVRMTPAKYDDLKKRTKKFALDIIALVQDLPEDWVTSVLGRQLLRAGTSVGANYRAACRAKSPADFISKMGTVEEEADESGYWLELIVEAGLAPSS